MTVLLFVTSIRRQDVFIHVTPESCGKSSRDVVHAIAEGGLLRWSETPRKTWEAVCGSRVYPLLVAASFQQEDGSVKGGSAASVPWPPRVAGLRGAGWTRCKDCHRLTGRPRPRWTATPEAAA